MLVAAGGKWGGVGLWDAENTEGAQNGVHLYVPHRYLTYLLSTYYGTVWDGVPYLPYVSAVGSSVVNPEPDPVESEIICRTRIRND